jgi:hypothetical protein
MSHAFDPEVVELLREIVADPDSTITRVPTERLQRWIPGPSDTLSPHGSYLTRAEKHLVQAYREQAAWILLHVCIEGLQRRSPLVVTPATYVGNSRDAAHRLVASKELAPREAGPLGDVANGQRIDPRQAAAAALRFSPGDSARVCLAVALFQDGNSHSANRVLESVLLNHPSAVFAALAWENRGAIYCTRGEYAKAFECSWRSSDVTEPNPRALVSCVAMAMQGGEQTAAHDAARRLKGVCSDESAIRPYAVALERARAAGLWAPTSDSSALTSSLRARWTFLSEVCNAFI